MAEPWFSPQLFPGIYVGLVGGLAGAAVGGVGGKGGDLARRGQSRRWVAYVLNSVLILGLVSVLARLIGLSVGQPPAIWSALVLVGLGIGGLAWVVRRSLNLMLRDGRQRMTILLPPGSGQASG